jgi:hypothetical protein
MGRGSRNQFNLSTIEWVTILLLAVFCAFALVPEVRDWVLSCIQQISTEFMNGEATVQQMLSTLLRAV